MMGCSNLNGYFICPSQCQATVNAWGCTECQCQQNENTWRGEGQHSTSPSVTSFRTSGKSTEHRFSNYFQGGGGGIDQAIPGVKCA